MTMLDRMRRHKGWLKWSLALVCLTFVLFYIPDFLRSQVAGPRSVLAAVNGREVTVSDFQRRYQAQLAAYRSAYGGNVSEQLLRQLGIEQQILQQLVDEQAALAEAERLGIRVTDEELSRQILAIPAFQENGQFIGEQRYEQILRMLNDSLQGTAVGLGFVLGGTPEFLMDPRRGIYSYSALHSRLAQNAFATKELVDFSGPVLHLSSLTVEDFYLLLGKIRHVYAAGDSARYLLPDSAIANFMEHCANRIGDSFFRTPRTTITSFINLLAILEQNPGTAWKSLIGEVHVEADEGGKSDVAVDSEDALASFKL